MSINDVKLCYKEFGEKYNDINSTFNCCSYYDSKPKKEFVSNKTSCINFDKVKEHINKLYKSVDSLYLSENKNTAYFIEFKNSTYKNVHNDLVEKAIKSTIIHHNVCKLSRYDDYENCVVCVLSFDKALESNPLTNIYIKNAGYLDGLNISDLENSFKNQFYRDKNDDVLPFEYDSFKIIFDKNFDTFVNQIV